MESNLSASLPSSRKRLTDVITTALRERLDQGVYRPGDRLPSEAALCEEFGVSRTVVREAVASMRLAGGLVSRPGMGVYVAENTDSPINFDVRPGTDAQWALHLMELRVAIEVQSAGLAAERRTPRDLVAIAQAFDDFCTVDADVPGRIRADIAFHLAIAQASQNPHFVQILSSSVNDVATDLRIKYVQDTDLARRTYEKRTVRDHGAILAAITRRDMGAARAAMSRHLEESISRYRKWLTVER